MLSPGATGRKKPHRRNAKTSTHIDRLIREDQFESPAVFLPKENGFLFV
jgi:hypothetical protein